MVVIVILIAFVVQLTIGSLISAVILRAACAMFNKFFRKDAVTPVAQEATVPEIEPPPVSDDNPYSTPWTSAAPSVSSELAGGVNVPSFQEALVIMFASIFCAAVFSFLLGLAIGSIKLIEAEQAGIVASVLGALSGLAIQSLCISNMLPTSFGRAITISIFMILIAIAIVVPITIVAGGVGMLFG